MIIFDFDGVIVDSEIIYLSCETMFLEKYGILIERDEFIRRFMGASPQIFFSMLDEEHRKFNGTPLPQNFEPDLKAYTKDRMGKELKPVNGIRDFLSSLETKRCIASSSNKEVILWKLGVAGLDGCFHEDQCFSAEMVKYGKPNPDLFLYAAEKNNEKPDNCLVVEDSANGIKAAVAAGMTAIGFCGGGHSNPSHIESLKTAGAEYICVNTSELLEKIKELHT